MKKLILGIMGLAIVAISCEKDYDNDSRRVVIPDFDFPKSISFEPLLSNYAVFQGNPAKLNPSTDFHLLELSSILFTDYAHKQRLVKVPVGTQMTRLSDGSIDFPNGSILTKTFYYNHDERDTSLGRRILETRLLIKENGIWNVATYVWNESQTDAVLSLDGLDTQVDWIDANGKRFTTVYHIPNENECIACHQSKSRMAPIGTKLRNLNRMVERDGMSLNQLSHLQATGVLSSFDVNQVSFINDYNDPTASLAERGRAYLAMNCAHCHNPHAWDKSAERDFDFRYETSLSETGISREKQKISRALTDGEMPFIGTTVLDEAGVDLILAYLNEL